MVMTCRHASSPAHLVLLVLLFVTPQLAGAAPVWGGEGGEGGVVEEEEEEGRARTDLRDDSLGGGLSLPRLRLSTWGGPGPGDNPVDPARLLHVLLEALDHPGTLGIQENETGARPENTGDGGDAGTGGASAEQGNEEEEEEEDEEAEADGGGRTRVGRVGDQSHLTASQGDVLQAGGGDEEKDAGLLLGELGFALVGTREGGPNQEEREEGGPSDDLGSPQRDDSSALHRKTRGYFQNIDLGLQDNEILPPLKGYKAYNTQLARAGKKQHWQEEQAARSGPAQGGNFMDDFDNEGEELEEEVEKEEESLSRLEEEARARAEKQEVLRQQEEAERAREEEQRLADIASDMLLQYMGRKQPPYMKPRQKSSSMGAAAAVSNTAEDKRSEEVVTTDGDDGGDDDDMDQQMIDRLIEISSKLHLPADDVVEIISDVEEKKKKRKELQQTPSNAGPVKQRFRPLVPPPLAAPPMYHYTASSNPKKAPYKYRSNKKWQKDKVKSYKQDFWYKPQKQLDYWYKPQKQFLAFPSYPYYQKPYRAYYPVYFPYPKQHYYGKPAPSMDQPFGPQELDLPPPRRRFRPGGKGRGGQGWRQQPPPQIPVAPYISNYILPHPRTYQPLPPPKPITPARRGRRPHYFYPQVTPPADDYEEDGLVPQLDSEEELENFIERIYMKRRLY